MRSSLLDRGLRGATWSPVGGCPSSCVAERGVAPLFESRLGVGNCGIGEYIAKDKEIQLNAIAK